MASSTNLKKIDVVALALGRRADQRFLLARRGPAQSGAGEWEFPGGKVEAGESQKQALLREIEEELSFKIKIEDLDFVGENTHAYPQKTICLYLWSYWVEEAPVIQLTEHDEICWCLPDEMRPLRLSAGDQPFIDLLKNYSKK